MIGIKKDYLYGKIHIPLKFYLVFHEKCEF